MSPLPEKWNLVREIGTVRGIIVGVYESGGTVKAAMVDTCEGITPICEIDKVTPGAQARAICLAETVYEALQMADLTWEEAPEARS